MSTFIHVSRSGNTDALLNANKEQAQANRDARLQKSNQEKAANLGKTIRDGLRDQKGINSDGKIIYGARRAGAPKTEPTPYLYQDIVLASAWQARQLIWSNKSSPGLFWRSQLDPIAGYVESYTIGVDSSATLPYRKFTLSQKVACGNGSKILDVESWADSTGPILPNANYSWDPTVEQYVYDSQTSSWLKVLAGLRRGRLVDTTNYVNDWLVLPAGGKKCVLINFQRLRVLRIDATAMHASVTNWRVAYNDGVLDAATKEYLDAALASRLAPGADVLRQDALTIDRYPEPLVIYNFVEPQVEIVYEHLDVVNNVFICSENAIRQLIPTDKLRRFLNYVNPNEFPRVTTYYMRHRNFEGIPLSVPDSLLTGTRFTEIQRSKNWQGHAGVFKELNKVYAFTDSTQIKNLDTDYQYAVVPDTSEGGNHYSVLDDAFASSDPFYYKRGLSSESDATYRRLGSATLRLASIRPKLTDIDNLFKGFDCEDSSYCQRMCQALGFRASDLSP